MDSDNIRITVSITPELVKKFHDLTRQIGVSGTALLARTLPAELDYLAEIPSNSKRARTAHRLVAEGDECGPGRLNFTINRQVAERMDSICLFKGVPRNTFIRSYIDFLVDGDTGVCEGPLSKVGAILANPRQEYQEKKPEHANPYSFLHLSEETISEVIAIMTT
jgi:hypothetical protein